MLKVIVNGIKTQLYVGIIDGSKWVSEIYGWFHLGIWRTKGLRTKSQKEKVDMWRTKITSTHEINIIWN
jgi:hypothetical protein